MTTDVNHVRAATGPLRRSKRLNRAEALVRKDAMETTTMTTPTLAGQQQQTTTMTTPTLTGQQQQQQHSAVAIAWATPTPEKSDAKMTAASSSARGARTNNRNKITRTAEDLLAEEEAFASSSKRRNDPPSSSSHYRGGRARMLRDRARSDAKTNKARSSSPKPSSTSASDRRIGAVRCPGEGKGQGGGGEGGGGASLQSRIADGMMQGRHERRSPKMSDDASSSPAMSSEEKVRRSVGGPDHPFSASSSSSSDDDEAVMREVEEVYMLSPLPSKKKAGGCRGYRTRNENERDDGSGNADDEAEINGQVGSGAAMTTRTTQLLARVQGSRRRRRLAGGQSPRLDCGNDNNVGKGPVGARLAAPIDRKNALAKEPATKCFLGDDFTEESLLLQENARPSLSPTPPPPSQEASSSSTGAADSAGGGSSKAVPPLSGGLRSPLRQLPLSVRREQSQRRQRRQDEQRKRNLSPSMQSPNGDSTRRNLDKRTARLRFAADFRADIERHRCRDVVSDGARGAKGGDMEDANGVVVAVRKRPIFDYELDRGDFDVVDAIDGCNDSADDAAVVVHNCTLFADMKQMFVKPVRNPCAVAFDETCTDDDVYRRVAEPLVDIAARGGIATILMYGQTGSGKSHTMSGIEERVGSGLFEIISSMGTSPKVTVQFVELCGKRCEDLLRRGSLVELKIADHEDGSVRLLNSTQHAVESPDDLRRVIAKGKSRRATEATDKNGVSSRSHAVCRIQVTTSSGKSESSGLLTLIDCAGSERRHDSMYHSAERQKESAEINASLWALKECIRARTLNAEVRHGQGTPAHVPYRSSNLTRILRPNFEQDSARMCVIACVAPNATDTEHTLETLKTISSLVGKEGIIEEMKSRAVTPVSGQKKTALIAPKLWDHKQLVTWLEKKKICAKVPSHVNGKLIMRMSVLQMRAQLFDERYREVADTLFNALRKENDRVSKHQQKERLAMAKARKEQANDY